MDDDEFRYGELVRDLRLEQKLSQRELARHARVNRSTLRRIEEGIAGRDIKTFARLYRLLGHELEVLQRESLVERLRRQAQFVTDPSKRSQLAVRILLAMNIHAS